MVPLNVAPLVASRSTSGHAGALFFEPAASRRGLARTLTLRSNRALREGESPDETLTFPGDATNSFRRHPGRNKVFREEVGSARK